MTIHVNGKTVELLPGMRVRHALISSGMFAELRSGKKVYDEWGNEVGLDGAVIDGMRLFVR